MNDHDDDDDHDGRDLAELAAYSADLSATLAALPPGDPNRAALQTEFDRVVTLLAAAVARVSTP